MLPSIARARLSLALAVTTGALLVTALPASAAIPAGNLLTNPGAESGTTGWAGTGAFETVAYGTSGFPTTSDSAAIGGGNNFFAGGVSALSTGTQTVDVSGAATEIDAGGVNADLSGYLGGFSTQEDNTVVTATFLDGSSSSLGSVSIGPVTASDRANATTLLFRESNGAVPSGTRSIQVVQTMTRLAGSYDDGYADNLSLSLSSDPCANPGAISGDVIVGDDDPNTLNGTPNDDVIIGNGGADRINGGGGNDKICGGSGGDVIKGGPGNDQLFGQDGPDTLSGGAGADVLSGGAGVDTVTYSGLTADENIDLADNGANDGAAGEGDDIRPDVENAIGGNGNDDLEGNDAANQLYGGPGADFMFGLGGNDSLNGETGFDHLFGEGDGVKDKLKCGPPPASGVNGGTAATDDGDTVVNCLT